MKTPPPGDSPDAPLTPLPPPPRRKTPQVVQLSPDHSDDRSAVPVEEQKGLSWLARYPNDPLRALCLHYGVLKAPVGVRSPLPQTLDMEVVQDSHMPTHVLALSKQSTFQTQPTLPLLMVPIHAKEWEEKMTMPLPLTTTGSTLPVPHLDKTQPRPRPVITLPVVLFEVAYPETMSILLLFALGLEHLPNLLANYLLPVNVVAEFPNAHEMSNLMAKRYNIDDIIAYVEQNSQIWGNALNLGVKDTKILDMVHNAWKVTAAARDILLNPRRTSTE